MVKPDPLVSPADGTASGWPAAFSIVIGCADSVIDTLTESPGATASGTWCDARGSISIHASYSDSPERVPVVVDGSGTVHVALTPVNVPLLAT